MRHNKGLDRAGNDCFTQCVAYYLDMHPAHVPFFINYPDWHHYTQRWFRRHGYHIEQMPYKRELMSNKRTLYILQGVSPLSKATKKMHQAVHHAAVFRNGKCVFDPNYRRHPFKGRPKLIYIIKKI